MLTKVFVSISLGAAVLTGCGNDPNTGTPDACVGHSCFIVDDPFPHATDPEGGQIIFEHMTFDTDLQGMFPLAGASTATRVMAYFMSAQTPESNPLPMPNICNNLEATKGWPLHVGAVHTDVDVGTLTLIGKNAAGAAVSFDVPRGTGPVDQIGRPHDIFYQLFQPTAADLLKPDSFYDVKFGGSAAVAATTLQRALYLPAEYSSVQNPGLEDNGPLEAGVEFPVAWTVGNSANKPPDTELVGNTILGVTWLLDVTGSPTHMCIAPAGAQAFTIAGTAITEYKTIAAARGQRTDKLILLRSAIAHQLDRLPLTSATTGKRRIDMLSLECWAQLMDVR